MTPDEQAGKILDDLIRYLESIDSVETVDERDTVIGKIEDHIYQLDAVKGLIDPSGPDEDMLYESQRDIMEGWA